MMMSTLRETPVKFTKGPSSKKYKVWLRDKTTRKIRTLTFGAKGYEQFRDSTPKSKGGGLYTHKNHGDIRRRRSYFSRHSGGRVGKTAAVAYEKRKSVGLYTPKLLSHIYLW